MKRVLLACVSALGLAAMAGAANAADLPRRPAYPAKAPAYLAPVYNWTGPYVGINAGGAWGNSNWSGNPTGDFDVSGGLVGATIGYNWQVPNNFVLGVEGDVAWTNISGSTNNNCAAGCETANNWLATVRGRVGYAYDRILPYITGGIAFGDIEATRPGTAGTSGTETGWTLGGGIEFALVGNWSAKVEYLYVDLGSVACGAACGTAAPNDIDFSTSIVRGGLNFRF
jgi:outer membrane immunogenic protein